MPPIESEFVFALCNPGSEKALKREVETMALGWRLSNQRRGFVTFKSDAPFTLDSLAADLALARRCCLSLGKSATREEAVERVGAATTIHHARFADRKLQGVPGGVVLALLLRGVSVVGVDPVKMAEVVLASAIDNRQQAPKDRP